MAAGLLEAGGEAAPAHVAGEKRLLLRGGETVFPFQLFQQADGGDVVEVALRGRPDAELVVSDPVVMPLVVPDLRVQDGGRELAALHRYGPGELFFFGWFPRDIDRVVIAFLEGEDVLPGLLGKLHGKLGLPEHFVQPVVAGGFLGRSFLLGLFCDFFLLQSGLLRLLPHAPLSLRFLYGGFDLVVVKVGENVKVQEFQLLGNHILQALILAALHQHVRRIAVQMEFQQIHGGLDRHVGVCHSGEGKIHRMEITVVGVLSKLSLAVLVDGGLGLFQPGFIRYVRCRYGFPLLPGLLRRGLHQHVMAVVQRVLRHHAVKVLAGQLLVDQREGWVVEADFLLSQMEKFILLGAKEHSVSQSEAVFPRRRRRRVQLVVSGFQLLEQVSVQLLQRVFTALRQVRLLGNDPVQGVPQQGQNVVVFLQGVGGLVAGIQAARAVGEDVEIQQNLRVPQLGLKVVEVVDHVHDSLSNGGSLPSESLLLSPGREAILLSGVQIASVPDQLSDPLFHLGPAQKEIGVRVDDAAQPEANALAVVVLGNLPANDGGIGPARAVLVLEELHVLCGGLLLEVLRVNAELALLDVAAAHQNGVNVLLGDSKSGGLFRLRFRDCLLLLRHGGQSLGRYA